MTNGQIFARKSTARGRLDLEYLDETSNRKVSLRERADMEQQIGRKLKHFTDYASKESLGQVHAAGFMHNHIRRNPDGSTTAPAQLSNAERKHRITEAWQHHLDKFSSQAKRPVIAHRLIFSMSKEQHDALVAVGINPDKVLHSSLKKVMRKFAEKFHPGDSIGFAYGLRITRRRTFTPISRCVRARRKVATWDATRRATAAPNPKGKWLYQVLVRAGECGGRKSFNLPRKRIARCDSRSAGDDCARHASLHLDSHSVGGRVRVPWIPRAWTGISY